MARARRNWTSEEDDLLRGVVSKALAHSLPLLWRELAKSVPGRSNKDCRRRWWNSLADGTAKGSWSEEEDELLLEAVRKHGTNWSRVARAVRLRNSDQCSSHWSQVLDPEINFCDWTTKEDEQLLHAVLTHGTNWTAISTSHVPKRTTLALKNRYSTVRMRHENGSRPQQRASHRAHRGSLSSSGGNFTASTQGTRTAAGVGNQLNRNVDEDERGEEDDEEDDDGAGNDEDDADDAEEDDDDDEGEERGDQDTDDHEVSRAHLNTACKRADSATVGFHPKESNMTTSSVWETGNTEQNVLFDPKYSYSGTSPLSLGNWASNTAESTSYNNLYSLNPSSFLGLGQNSLASGPNSRALSTNVPYPTYGADAMDTTFSPSPDYSNSNKSASEPTSNGTLMGIDHNPSQSSHEVPLSPTTQKNASAAYQVSINMICTGTQLATVMAGVAGAGTGVTFKIDPNLHQNSE